MDKLTIEATQRRQQADAHEIAQGHANGCAYNPLQQTFGEDEADDGAAISADGAQHANISAALGHDGAEGVEDNEAAHDEREETENAHDRLSDLETVEEFIPGGETAQTKVLTQRREDGR